MSSLNSRKRCGHCDQYLTVPVYKRHKSLYFNISTCSWTKEQGDDDESHASGSGPKQPTFDDYEVNCK